MQERLSTLFDRYFNGEASYQEIQELKSLIRNSENDDELKRSLSRAWKNLDQHEGFFDSQRSDEIFKAIVKESPDQAHAIEPPLPVTGGLSWLWYAAAVFLIGLGIVWQTGILSKKDAILEVSKSAKPSVIYQDQTVLVLGGGTPIYLNKSAIGDIGVEGQAIISKTGKQELTYKVKGSEAGSKEGVTNTLFAARGDQYKLVLPDGSKVWLNAFSSIEYPSSFGEKERSVKISGEAYFEISEDKNRPFTVRFKDGEVKVLGTRFNIMAYQDESRSKTTLVEGSIALSIKDRQYKLKPMQQAAIEPNGALKIISVDVEDEIAWQNGWIRFKNASVQEVMRQITRWYPFEIVYDSVIPETQFTGMVPVNAKIDEVLEMLRYAGINCNIQGNQIRVQ